MGRTGQGGDALVHGVLVAAAGGAEGFVAGGQGDDEQQGDDERGGGLDVPLAEDDAEVIGVPGEDHLAEGVWSDNMDRFGIMAA